MRGIIKNYDKTKGFGFISVENHRDVFFHYSHLIMEGFKLIEAGTVVEFELVETKRGKQAHNIIRLT